MVLVSFAVVVLIGVLVYCLVELAKATRQIQQHTIDAERRRTDELLKLLEARSAPAEFAAYVHDTPPVEVPEFLYSDDGLAFVPVSDFEDAT